MMVRYDKEENDMFILCGLRNKGVLVSVYG